MKVARCSAEMSANKGAGCCLCTVEGAHRGEGNSEGTWLGTSRAHTAVPCSTLLAVSQSSG